MWFFFCIAARKNVVVYLFTLGFHKWLACFTCSIKNEAQAFSLGTLTVFLPRKGSGDPILV